ncbi:MAG: hypothetical protein BWY99_01657 [Synergistetes bacterium ADurb.BinA166]|nr:MAG: hypothetical protein BWY99_01657 [Synergistetes bacterium ADurb.BinA166]
MKRNITNYKEKGAAEACACGNTGEYLVAVSSYEDGVRCQKHMNCSEHWVLECTKCRDARGAPHFHPRWKDRTDRRLQPEFPGIYDHYRGGVYLAERLERDADTGRMRVSYRSLLFGTFHSRRLEEWEEEVAWPDGCLRPRFTFRGLGLAKDPTYKVESPKALPAEIPEKHE